MTISAGTPGVRQLPDLINDSPSISIGAGATSLTFPALASYILSADTTLSASGTATPATINGGTSVSLGSQPITLNYDGSHPALTISQGTLLLNGNAFTVNGPALPSGCIYTVHPTSRRKHCQLRLLHCHRNDHLGDRHHRRHFRSPMELCCSPLSIPLPSPSIPPRI